MVNSKSFTDFVLRIGKKVGNTYPVLLESVPWGESDSQISIPINEYHRLRKLSSEVEKAYRSLHKAYLRQDAHGIRVLSRRLENQCQELGADLFNTIVQDNIRREYDRSLGFADHDDSVLRVLLRIAADEWEDLMLELI